MKHFSIYACTACILIACSGQQRGGESSAQACLDAYPSVLLELVDWHEGPVISEERPDAVDIKHGLEGGSVIRQEGLYHLFTSEQHKDPKWVSMRLGYWTSADGICWERESTLYESSGDYTGTDPRAAFWSPMPVFDEDENNWFMTYVAYHCKPDSKEQFTNNFNGRIWQARSEVPGIKGIGGPYRDMGIIMEPGPESDEWEGLQGTDSFYPFKINGKWLAFFGSAKTEKLPIQFWGVGLAQADRLQGPWKRLSDRNPTDFKEVFAENPIVTRLGDSIYIAVMDAQGEGFGYSLSYNGRD
jgi:hypothetical protein